MGSTVPDKCTSKNLNDASSVSLGFITMHTIGSGTRWKIGNLELKGKVEILKCAKTANWP